MLTLGFAGLPSAGKSTIVNALAGKRVLESGVCRTTTEPCLVGATNAVGAQKWVRARLESDDGVEFCALDLPGICDAEDKKGTFNKVTREWAAKCDVVVWVTDARTAFLTTHETSEYSALRAAIQEKADEDGTLYQLLVVIAKFDASTKSTDPTKNNTHAGMVFLEDEIRTGSEETTIESCFERVERTFPETRVVKFSAFARIANSGSETLRALVSARSERTDGTNAAFDLRWATENLVEKRLAQMARVLRSTRQRAIAAETRAIAAETRIRTVDERLAVLTSRVDPSPVYDWHAELVFKNLTGDIVFSLGVMLDSAARQSDITMAMKEQTQTALLDTSSSHIMRFGGTVCSGGSQRWSCSDGLSIEQVTAPLVRPVYGDIFLAPPSVTLVRGNNGALAYEGTRRHLCMYTGRGADKDATYVLKVGEASRDQLDALLALGLKHGSCLVSIFWSSRS